MYQLIDGIRTGAYFLVVLGNVLKVLDEVQQVGRMGNLGLVVANELFDGGANFLRPFLEQSTVGIEWNIHGLSYRMGRSTISASSGVSRRLAGTARPRDVPGTRL